MRANVTSQNYRTEPFGRGSLRGSEGGGWGGGLGGGGGVGGGSESPLKQL